MFNLFKKREKSKLEQLIDKEGFDVISQGLANEISMVIKHRYLAKQFALEEIEAASKGNSSAIQFARNSGFTPSEYQGALQNSLPEIDGANGPQQMLVKLCMQLQSDRELMAKFRIAVVEKIMQKFCLGKYNENNPMTEKLIEELQSLLQDNEVRKALEESQRFGRVSIAQSALIQKVNELINKISENTGKTPEEISRSFL
jgi:hypothetical protein